MIYQTDTRLRLEARDDECFVFCILDIFEELTKINLTIEQIDTIHKLTVKMNYIGLDGYIRERGVEGIAQIASGVVGKHAYIKRVTENDEYNFLIARWGREERGKLLTHFTRMFLETPKIVKYDPYSPSGSKTVREGIILDYRYIFGEAI